MAFTSHIHMGTIELGAGFEFFGPDTQLKVTVTAMTGGADYLKGDRGWDWIHPDIPVASEWDRSVQVPVVDQPGWRDQSGATTSGWSYAVEVVATALGHPPYLWAGSATPTAAQPVVTLAPADGTLIGPSGGSGGSTSVTADPDVAGAYLIGE